MDLRDRLEPGLGPELPSPDNMLLERAEIEEADEEWQDEQFSHYRKISETSALVDCCTALPFFAVNVHQTERVERIVSMLILSR